MTKIMMKVFCLMSLFCITCQLNVALAQVEAIRFDSIYTPKTATHFLREAKRQNNARLLGLAYAVCARTEHEYANNPKNALQHYLTSQRYLLQVGDSLHYYWVCEYMVMLLNSMNNRAFIKHNSEVMHKALSYYKRTNQFNREALVLSELGWALIQQKKYSEAEKYARLGIEASRKANKWDNEFRNVILLLQTYQYQQRYKEGLAFLETFSPAAIQRNDTIALRTVFFYEGLLNQLDGQPRRAIASFLHAHQFAPKLDTLHKAPAFLDIKFHRDVSKHLKQTYAEAGNYRQAIHWATQYEYWFTSLNKHQNYSPQLWKGINELVASSRTIQKVALREQEMQQRVFWQRVLLVPLVIIAILTTLLALAYGWRLKTLKKITRQQQEISIQQSDLRKRDSDLKQVQWDLETQERERQRVGRDLHDGLGGLLSSIRLEINNLDNASAGGQETLVKLVDDACTELRVVAWNLNPITLYKWGLPTALQDFVIRMRPSFVGELNLQIVGSVVQLSDEKSLSVYRIVQELITNAVRHARASHIWVELCYRPNELLISVEDDGKGLEMNENGMGLINVKQRIDSLQAHLDVQTQTNKGTTFLFSLEVA